MKRHFSSAWHRNGTLETTAGGNETVLDQLLGVWSPGHRRLSGTESQGRSVLRWDGKKEKHCLTIPGNTAKRSSTMPICLVNFRGITDLAIGLLVQEMWGRKPPGDQRLGEWTFEQSSGNFPISRVFPLMWELANRYALQALEQNWILCAPYCEGSWGRVQDLEVRLPGFEFILYHLLSLWLWGFNLLGASISSFVKRE